MTERPGRSEPTFFNQKQTSYLQRSVARDEFGKPTLETADRRWKGTRGLGRGTDPEWGAAIHQAEIARFERDRMREAT